MNIKFLVNKSLNQKFMKKVFDLSFYQFNNSKLFLGITKLSLGSNNNCNFCGLAVLYSGIRTSTILTKQLNMNKISKRTIMCVINAAAKQSASHSYTYSPFISSRTYVSAHGGQFKFKTTPSSSVKPNQPTAFNDTMDELKSDITGKHKIGILGVCLKAECKNTNCAEGTAESNPCGISGDVHQQIDVFVQAKGVVYELNGAITHKIPAGKDGAYLNGKDFQGKDQTQYIMKEKGVTPISPSEFKEDNKVTSYLQSSEVSYRMIQNASVDPVININNKTPSTLLIKPVDTPVDEGF